MPRDRTTQVRIYCICGQRMKVGSDMYGRPGKCIACRQKIRVPRLDEIPEDTDEIHLIDHPEFLRSVKRSPDASATDSQAPDSAEYPELPPDEAPGADRVGESGTVALDVCEPLRTLASLEHRLTHKIELLEQQPETQEEIEVDARELRAFRKRVKRAREELDEQLRQRLMETAIELTTARETIGELLASGRVGEMKFAAYREQAEKLRRRRDSLERRQANLRGWLSARNPYEAGGYVRLPLDHPPPSRTQLSFPHEPPDTCALVDWWVQSLRDAMVRREQQERTCAELDRMKSEERVSPGDVDLRRAEAAAEAGRAKADIAFCRERLEELGRDYAGDQRTLAAQLDLLRGRLDVGEIYRDQFDDDEKALLGIKADLAKACDLIKRSLSANSAQDVPRPHGTYLGRLAEGGTARRVPPDAWILWFCRPSARRLPSPCSQRARCPRIC